MLPLYVFVIFVILVKKGRVSVLKCVVCVGRCSAFGCPYSAMNKDKEWVLADRLGARSEPDMGCLSVKGNKHSYGRSSPEMK